MASKHPKAGLVVPKARRALAGLRRRSELAELSRVARRRGIRAWIVGGAVRDRAAGLAVEEVDVAVSRDAEGVARELERSGHGRAVFLSRDRPGPRVFRLAGKRVLDIAEVEGGSILVDLARRDFTVNAVAVALDGEEIVDPFGGLSDLARGRLRCVRAENLLEDPLRALRAARFIATHGLRPDRATMAAARRVAPLLPAAAPERIGAELSKLLASKAAAPALRWAARAGVLGAALGQPLPAAHAAGLARAAAACDDPTARALPPVARRKMRLAWIAVRCGLSEPEARRWLRERRWLRGEAEEVARVVGLAASARRIRGRSDAWRWVIEAGPRGKDALRLLARLGPAFRRHAVELRPLVQSPLATVPVGGGDVVRWLKISPGPEVGALLAELRLAAAMGEVKTRRQARHWLSVQVRSRPVTGYNS